MNTPSLTETTILQLQRELAARERYLADLHDTMDKVAAIVGSKPRNADDLLAKLAARDAELAREKAAAMVLQQETALIVKRLEAEVARVREDKEAWNAEAIRQDLRALRAEAELARVREEHDLQLNAYNDRVERLLLESEAAHAHITALKDDRQRAEAERDAAVRRGWNAAIVLGHNICVQENDRINDNDGSTEAMDALSECARRIKGWVDPDDKQLAEMVGEADAAIGRKP